MTFWVPVSCAASRTLSLMRRLSRRKVSWVDVRGGVIIWIDMYLVLHVLEQSTDLELVRSLRAHEE